MSHTQIMRVGGRAVLGVALAAAAAGGLAIAAPAPQTAPAPTLRTDDGRIPAGEALVVRGRGFARDAHITLRAGRDGDQTSRIGSAHTGRLGTFVADIRIDADAASGRYVAIACQDRCRVKATLRFRVHKP